LMGPHLHFSASRDGKFFDAETLNLDGMRVLDKEQRDVFAAVVAKYNPQLDAIPLPAVTLAPSVEDAPAAAPAAASSAAPGASAAPVVAEDPSLGDPGASDGSEAPSAKPAAASSAAAAPGKAPGSSVYLSDKELLKLQSATDEGEVSE